MITLDQVQLLEKKVEAIVSKMNDLQRQNIALQEKNRDLIEKNSLLMQKISSFEADQNRIEQGILNALDRLNSMENSALKVGTSATTTQNVQEVVPSNTENVTEETSQPNELTNFSNIQTEQVVQEQEVQQNFEENNYQPQEESLNFSEEKLDEEINSEEETNTSSGLNLNFDFDDNVQEEDNQQAQLGIF